MCVPAVVEGRALQPGMFLDETLLDISVWQRGERGFFPSTRFGHACQDLAPEPKDPSTWPPEAEANQQLAVQMAILEVSPRFRAEVHWHGTTARPASPAASPPDRRRGLQPHGVRRRLRTHHIRTIILTRRGQQPRPAFDREACRQRPVIERRVGPLKECRQIATRSAKLAIHFLAILELTILQLYLQVGFANTAREVQGVRRPFLAGTPCTVCSCSHSGMNAAPGSMTDTACIEGASTPSGRRTIAPTTSSPPVVIPHAVTSVRYAPR